MPPRAARRWAGQDVHVVAACYNRVLSDIKAHASEHFSIAAQPLEFSVFICKIIPLFLQRKFLCLRARTLDIRRTGPCGPRYAADAIPGHEPTRSKTARHFRKPAST